MCTEIDRIEATLLAREKEAYARVRREHGDIDAWEYCRYFTPQERVDTGLIGWLYGLKSAFVFEMNEPAAGYDKEKVASEFSAMLTYLRGFEI
jgi:hypothetical protein